MKRKILFVLLTTFLSFIFCELNQMGKPSEDEITNKIGNSSISVEDLSSGATEGECNSYIKFPSGSEYSSNAAPSSGTGPSVTVTGNNSAIPGGSLLLTIETQSSPYLIVSVKGVPGYYRLANQIDQRTNKLQLEVSFSNTITLNQITLEFRAENNSKETGNIFEYTVNITQVKTGKVQVSLSFDQDTDLDLHVFEPDGTDVYYMAPNSKNGGKLDLDANADCGDSAMKKINNENIYWSDPKSGKYRVILNYFQFCSKYCKTDSVNWTITVNNQGDIKRYRGQMTKKNVGEFWEIARFTVK